MSGSPLRDTRPGLGLAYGMRASIGRDSCLAAFLSTHASGIITQDSRRGHRLTSPVQDVQMARVFITGGSGSIVMKAYIATRQEAEARLRISKISATILRPWHVLQPGHR
jgi:hypothetical protein